MSIIDAIILGVIQGLTEFLPVSSSGHLELGKVILGQEIEAGLLFSLVLHAATALSTIVVFRKDIWEIIRELFKFEWNESTQFVAKILISAVPVGVVGILFKNEAEALFEGNVLLVGAMLLVTGFLLLMTHYTKGRSGKPVGYKEAIIIGIAQAIAILPGISRSGATIGTGLLIGVDKAKVARFSFLMVLLPIIGATMLELKDFFEDEAAHTVDITVLSIGFITAFIIGLAACTWMIGIVKKGKLSFFAIYCFIVGIIAIAWALLN
ncbi:undecaprenyl-diphosphate phosphatase [Flammeovirgaceae bacterium SG7u.111]|nr:undecaprenyl-diphosphate phosphatase [Flammeovirgaceae bacterium SG7u.132]WPO34149.1 undecaprenyl-diphosphate phosphatase [Flammeovirgaceae bacterium SG7u.111]